MPMLFKSPPVLYNLDKAMRNISLRQSIVKKAHYGDTTVAKGEMQAESLNLNILLGGLTVKVVSIARVSPNKYWYVAKHSHHDFEFHIIPEGKGFIRIEDQDFEVCGGEFYITGPHVMHEQRADSGDPMGEYCLECEIGSVGGMPAPCATSAQEVRLVTGILSRAYPRAFPDTAGVSSLFERLYRELDERQAGYFIKIQALILEILIDLFRMVSEATNAKFAYQVPQKSVDAFRMERILHFIGTNYRGAITLSDAAGALFLTPRQINRLMQKEFAQTFHEYLMEFRISVAKRLLAETDMPIESVAREAGFSSNYYMYQVFKFRNLLTPAGYRAGAASQAL